MREEKTKTKTFAVLSLQKDTNLQALSQEMFPILSQKNQLFRH